MTIIETSPPPYTNWSQMLFTLKGANMQSTADQPFTKIFTGTNYVVQLLVARQRSGAASILCLGGIYDQAGKTGNSLVSLTQSWVSLGSGSIVVSPLSGIIGTNLLSGTPILSLTTGSSSACTADFTIYGVDIT